MNDIKVNASRILSTSNHQVAKALEMIIDDGGEGVILRCPESVYAHGRSSNLVKLKVITLAVFLVLLSRPFPLAIIRPRSSRPSITVIPLIYVSRLQESMMKL